MTPSDAVHRENKWRLLRYRPRAEGPAYRTPIVLVPSLINRWYVLDLMPGKSFAEYLVAQGHDVYCIDWGTPGDEDRFLTFDDVCDRYLGRALRVARRLSGERPHVLGYCLGGTLAAIHAARRPEHVASLVAVAAPVGFHDDGLLSTWCRTKGFDVGALVEAAGNVPWPLMQLSFHLLRPTLFLSKLVGMADRMWNDAWLQGFLALERWGNDNVSLPGAWYQEYIEELYRKDGLLEGTLRTAGQPVRLGSIRCPTLAVTFEHDHIVPHASASILLDRIASTDKHRIHLPGGHVGAMVSKSAARALWPQLSAWWAARSTRPGQEVARRPEKPAPIKGERQFMS